MPERLSASEVRDLLHAKLDSLLQECDTVAYGKTIEKPQNKCQQKN